MLPRSRKQTVVLPKFPDLTERHWCHVANSGTARARPYDMKEEMAFLKYRREVVRAWPESPRKAVFLNGIETRIASIQQQSRRASSAALRLAAAN